MNGYLIAVIIMLIMFVAVMIRLMQEPIEEPLLLKPAPPEPAPAHPIPVAADSPTPNESAGVPTAYAEAARTAKAATPLTFEDPLDRLIAFERTMELSRDVPDVHPEPIELDVRAPSEEPVAQPHEPDVERDPEPSEHTTNDAKPPTTSTPN